MKELVIFSRVTDGEEVVVMVSFVMQKNVLPVAVSRVPSRMSRVRTRQRHVLFFLTVSKLFIAEPRMESNKKRGE
jgi:hypothetical protein